MKIRIWSDLHNEFGIFTPKDKTSSNDTLVLAGDVGTGKELEHSIWEYCLQFKHVIMVAGNHEYYHSDINTIDNKLYKLEEEIDNFYFLQDNIVEIDDVIFVGSTYWSEIPEHLSYLVRAKLNDYRLIKDFEPALATRLHRISRGYIKTVSRVYKNEKVVVVTHMAPSNLSTPTIFKDSQTNCAFMSHDDELVKNSKANLWIHGHMHNTSDYYIGDTRVVCNPRGYVNYEECEEFDEEFTVEI